MQKQKEKQFDNINLNKTLNNTILLANSFKVFITIFAQALFDQDLLELLFI